MQVASLDALGEFRLEAVSGGTYVLTLRLGTTRSCCRRSTWVTVDAEPAPAPGAARDRDPVADLARRMIELGETPPPTLSVESRSALAWELKDLCYSAWSSEPQRAATSADALRRLLIPPVPGTVAAADNA